MSELKPCPFCGWEAMLEQARVRKGYESSVVCCGCLVYMPTITYDTQEEADEAAIEAWNRRAGDGK